MNNIPPVIGTSPSQHEPQELPPLGSNPDDSKPITNVASAIESVLRQPTRIFFHLRQPGSPRLILRMMAVVLICALIYGFVVGTFSGHEQLWVAPIKIAFGLFISALICLPSLYIFACLGGSKAPLVEICGLVAGLLTLMTVLLIGFAPVAWIFSQSTESVVVMGALHLLFWSIAIVFALRFLKAGFVHGNGRFNSGLKLWTLILLIVMLQMTSALRPLIGTASTVLPQEKKFFIIHWMDCLQK